MGRVRALWGAVTTVVLLGVMTSPAWAGITEGQGLCTGEATIDGVTYTPANDTAEDPIVVPPGDQIVGYSGSTTFDNDGHSGSVWVDLGGVIPITVADWRDENGDLPNDQSAVGDQRIGDLRDEVPFELRGLYRVEGRHTAGGNTCAGFALVKFDGAVLDSPIALAAIGDIVLGVLLLLLASAVTARNAAAGMMRGRPVLGAIAGLLLGLGIAVLVQQLSIRPLDAVMLFGVPLLFLALGVLLATFPMLSRGRLAAARGRMVDLTGTDTRPDTETPTSPGSGTVTEPIDLSEADERETT